MACARSGVASIAAVCSAVGDTDATHRAVPVALQASGVGLMVGVSVPVAVRVVVGVSVAVGVGLAGVKLPTHTAVPVALQASTVGVKSSVASDVRACDVSGRGRFEISAINAQPQTKGTAINSIPQVMTNPLPCLRGGIVFSVGS